MIVEKHIRHLERLKETIEDQAKVIVLNNADKIISILQDRQLGIGLDSSGSPLRGNSGEGFYTRATELIAEHPPRPVKPKDKNEPYNFQWTGSFFDGMGLKILSRNNYSIFSSDGKSALLRKTYGKILDLSEENNQWINENIIEPELVKYVDDNWWRLDT